jgi:hypothetical protein
MGKSVSTEQSHAFIQALANNVDWSVLDGDVLQQQIIGQPTGWRRIHRLPQERRGAGARKTASSTSASPPTARPARTGSSVWKATVSASETTPSRCSVRRTSSRRVA